MNGHIYQNAGIKLYATQLINCDVSALELSVVGKYRVNMADPPTDILMELLALNVGEDFE